MSTDSGQDASAMSEATKAQAIRLKIGDAELELVGSREDVQRAWETLQPSVLGLFAGRSDPLPPADGDGVAPDLDEPKPKKPTPSKRPNRRVGRPPGNSNGREAFLEKLLTADFDSFPELPNDAQAVYTGLATLRWARDQLDIDGLSISEIHKFLSEKLRYSQTAQAYRYAFNQLPRATNAAGNPKVYRLMRAGDHALDAYFETIAAGGSQKEAETAGADAERQP